MADETQVRAEIRKILESGDGLTPRKVKDAVAKNLGIKDIDKWKPVIQDELKPYLPGKGGDEGPGSSKRKSTEQTDSPRETKARKLDIANDGLELSENRWLKISDLGGKKLVDIREYYEKDGELKPGVKGISLNVTQWQILDSSAKDISRAVKDENAEYTLDLGINKRVAISEYKGKLSVDIREVYDKDGEKLPGKKGIALTPDQWESIAAKVGQISDHLPKESTPAKKTPVTPGKGSSSGAKQEASQSKGEDFVKLSENRRASVSEFKGRKLLNLREYYEKNGEMLPGKKGISLTEEQARELLNKVDELSAGLQSKEEASYPLGARKNALVTSFKGRWAIDVREFYEKDGEERPGQKGLNMPPDQWNILKGSLETLVKQL